MPPTRLTPQHAPEYRALMLEAYAQHPDAFTSSAAERAQLPVAWWEDRLAAGEMPQEIVFGCFTDGVLSGVAGLAFETREKVKHKATLFGMYVPTRHRNLGLGSKLLATALTYARTRPGVLLVQLTVTDGNTAAQSLYERHGFLPFGLEPFAVAVGSGYVSKSHLWCALESLPEYSF
ncbi:MAG: acetyltransferase [Comamonadaceae bacterium]|nr:MAG: acetyltransferase [Comamonadaceae bacterium]